MGETLSLLSAVVALLLGLVLGKAWERYKLRDGRWIDRRKARESPHYILGLDLLVSNQLDLAIEELTKAAGLDADALEIHLILGNLYREKGQVSKAIQVHQQLLQRPRLTPLEHAYVLLCLGLDFRKGGFVDRAFEAFSEVVRLVPDNQYALLNLEKLHADQQQWEEAKQIRQRMIDAAPDAQGTAGHSILAFLENELGRQHLANDDLPAARRHFQTAIDIDRTTLPAYLHLGDVRLAQDRPKEAVEIWTEMVSVAPDRAYLAFDRLRRVFTDTGQAERFPLLCQRLIDEHPQDWRVRLALGQYEASRGAQTAALGLFLDALVHNPHALAIHQSVWRALAALEFDPSLVGRYVDLTRSSVFYLDPHVCLRCQYRSTELLWQCPQCHEWNTFVEERLTPAEEIEEVGA